LIHSIGRNHPGQMSAWIERRIFPGAHPPTLSEMMQIIEPHNFSLLDVENLRKKYLATPPTTRPTQVAAAPSSAAGEPAAFRVDVKNKYFAVIAAGLLIVGGGVIYRSYFIAEADKPVVTGIVREMKIVADKDEWRFTPEELIVDRGDKVVLTVVNEDEYDHGIAIDAFGISQRMPALETIKVEFVATQAGEFPYYCSVPCGEGDLPDGTHRTHFDMVGRIKVRDTMHSDEMMDQMMDH
jgi:plastocyanin